MTDQHRATPELWSSAERFAQNSLDITNNCLLELRARVEALEAAQHPEPSPAVELVREMQERIQEGSLTLADALKEWPKRQGAIPVSNTEEAVRAFGAAEISHTPADSLVERVALAIGESEREITETGSAWAPEARTAIRKVAAWLEQDRNLPETAAALREEANR
jgi:hypothetical protein